MAADGSIRTELHRFLDRYGIRDTAVTAALSGGADSVCLTVLLGEAAPAYGLTVTAVHVHHGIRGAEADRDAAFCRQLCERLGIACRVVFADAPARAAEDGRGLEQAAREVRYEALRAASDEAGAGWIFTAHHRDDQAETVLMHLLRGAGPAGLAGMAPVSGRIARPFLTVGREQIRAFLTERGLPWCEDSTNAGGGNDRSRVREEVLPAMERIRPGAAEKIAAAARDLREAAGFLADCADAFLKEEGFEEEAAPSVGASRLAGLPRALAAEVIRRAYARVRGGRGFLAALGMTDGADDRVRGGRGFLAALGMTNAAPGMTGEVRVREGTDLARAHIEAALRLAAGESGRAVRLPGGVTVRRDFDRLRFETDGARPDPALPEAEMRVEPADFRGEFAENDCLKCFDYDKMQAFPVLRFRRPGDVIAVYADGRHKKLQDLFTELKIDARERDRIPLVAAGSEVLWVVGYRRSAAYRPDGETKQVLTVRVSPTQPAAEGGNDG